mmetsp:Transcript_55646/g.178532  ORF Transcript_55646/g.178532 Transcript_55646/m.178532 type:complete len:233 (+) Transcript_55646:394-1092(+)
MSSHMVWALCLPRTPRNTFVPRRSITIFSTRAIFASLRNESTGSSESRAATRLCNSLCILVVSLPNLRRAWSASCSLRMYRVRMPSLACCAAMSASQPEVRATTKRANRTRVSSLKSHTWPKSMRPTSPVRGSTRKFPGCESVLKKPSTKSWCPCTRQAVRLTFTGSKVGMILQWSQTPVPSGMARRLCRSTPALCSAWYTRKEAKRHARSSNAAALGPLLPALGAVPTGAP